MAINSISNLEQSIDAEVLKLNLGALGDEAAECLTFLAETFFEDSPELVQNIRTGIEQGNPDQVRFNAHTLKSSSATLGATKLSKLCFQLETKARGKDLAGGNDLVLAIEVEFEQVKVALTNFQWF
jgi:HPt (histidine-containing phosphotransfer) domain-containing protein